MLGSLISWACFGLIVGAIVRLLTPGRQPLGCLYTILLGVAGSLTGGLISWLLRGGEPGDYHPSEWIMSIIGGLIVVFFGRRMFRSDE